ncbi:hypothetical protein ACFVUW_07240 [Streptomyces xiamenensis]|uniref:phosphoribosyltransferase-like protein n=1 Tax=Streptomyces xiamenensis TaxID=408015 RepID=UPI0036E872C1
MPSQTTQGVAWLSNFRPDDAPAAQQLIDSLYFFSSTTFRQGLTKHLQTVLTDTAPEERPAALYSVQSLRAHATMFQDGLLPLVSGPGGSELIVQNIARAAEREFNNTMVSNQMTTLEVLKERRVRRLVFLSDYAGSGDEAIKYALTWLRNKTIRSWRSLKLVQLHLVLFAASTAAHDRLTAGPWYDRVHVLHCGMDFPYADWEQSERKHIGTVCNTYAHSKDTAHGWGDSEGLVVFDHTIPNNLPLIVRQTKGPSVRGKWVPFFRNRTAPQELMQSLSDYRPDFNRQRRLRAIRQPRLATASQLQTTERSEMAKIIDVLAHVAARRRHPAQLAASLNISIPTAMEIIQLAQRLGLLDEQTRLTDAGWQELRRARRSPRRVASTLHGSTEPYYPSQLQGSR